ncbi:Crp/Fnr family transcriptional regulator [Larkinella sp. VNQ87]|uniref:Crp/Fnr family transcriptional regulator n=1 Tax=Larkinella sp. VNQ87 TaxID=3400921 RepID=UPI003BFF061D
MKQQLFNQLSSHGPLSVEAWQALAGRLVFQRLPAGVELFRPGDTHDYLYYIVSGLARGYYLDGGKEVTAWLATEGDVVFSRAGFLLRKENGESVELLENAELVCITRQDFDELCHRFPDIIQLGWRLMQRYLLAQENRLRLLRQAKAENRLEYFRQQHPEWWNRVQNQHIASFLGIDPATLSRLLRKR